MKNLAQKLAAVLANCGNFFSVFHKTGDSKMGTQHSNEVLDYLQTLIIEGHSYKICAELANEKFETSKISASTVSGLVGRGLLNPRHYYMNPLSSSPIKVLGHGTALPLIFTKKMQCRWILDFKDRDGRAMCCGKPVVEYSYWCADHHHVVYKVARSFL